MAFAQPKIVQTEILKGEPFFKDFSLLVSGGVETEIFQLSVPAGKKWYFYQIIINSRFESLVKIYVNDNIVLSLRTSDSINTMPLSLFPPRPIEAGSSFRATIEVRGGAPSSQVFCHLFLTQE